MENFQFLAKKSWYKTWWGVTIIVASCLFLSFSLAVGLLTWRYKQLIKQGYGEDLKKNIYGQVQVDPQMALARAELEIAERPYLGNQDAEMVIVEFIDFKCPICKEQDSILRQAISKYGQKIKLILRNFPIESLHPGASKLADLAFCSNEQGAYWLAHDYLFAQQANLTQNLTADNINVFIKEIGLDSKKFNACLVADKTKTEVNRDYAVGYKYGIAGTPTFFINGQKTQGNIPSDTWEEIINIVLNP
jgi:protein-disulfide isomerase